jgi:hypothetical protein
MKTKEEIEQLFKKWCNNVSSSERLAYKDGYTQCQEDMAKELEMHILVNEHDWSRNPQAQLKDFINSINKQDK